ncbi:MAG: peptidoglycan-binding protein [Chthoniobacterales bacterium]
MKKPLLITLALSLSVAQVLRADNENDKRRHKRPADASTEAPSQAGDSARPGIRPQVRQPLRQQSQYRVMPTQRTISRAPRALAPTQRSAVRSEAQLTGRNQNGIRPSNQPVTQNRNGNRNANRNGNRNFNRNSFTVARSRVIRTRHDRNWWHSHFNTTFVLFGGGYYYWWDGYWFPAYGYSPYYNDYSYGEPIYGYDNLDPGQVIENVQIALRDEGYYSGAIDGLVGPQTRAALAAYQQDHGLVVTEAVDEPTLVTLGLA